MQTVIGSLGLVTKTCQTRFPTQGEWLVHKSKAVDVQLQNKQHAPFGQGWRRGVFLLFDK
jgi:hypothetical protein